MSCKIEFIISFRFFLYVQLPYYSTLDLIVEQYYLALICLRYFYQIIRFFQLRIFIVLNEDLFFYSMIECSVLFDVFLQMKSIAVLYFKFINVQYYKWCSFPFSLNMLYTLIQRFFLYFPFFSYLVFIIFNSRKITYSNFFFGS